MLKQLIQHCITVVVMCVLVLLVVVVVMASSRNVQATRGGKARSTSSTLTPTTGPCPWTLITCNNNLITSNTSSLLEVKVKVTNLLDNTKRRSPRRSPQQPMSPAIAVVKWATTSEIAG